MSSEAIQDLIEQNISNMKVSGKLPTIYFDMDNTLVLFSHYGNVDQALEEMWTRNYFSSLPVFPEAPAVLRALINMGYRVCIVTNVIDSPCCRDEKEQFIKFHFPMIPDENVYILEPDERREEVLPDVATSILVDDYGVNIREWYAKGGVGVKKTYSGKCRQIPSIQTIADIFPVLLELNSLPKKGDS